MAGGAVFVDEGRAQRLPGSRLGVARFGGLAPADRVRLARLAASVVGASPQALLAEEHEASTAEGLLRGAGVSDEAIERVLRPLFGVITLDRTLSADPGYFRFLMAMLVRGPAVIPSDGVGMLAEWASAAVRQEGGAVELGAHVDALEADGEGRRVVGVRLADGRRCRRATWCWRSRARRRGGCWSRSIRERGPPAPGVRLGGQRGLRPAQAPVQRPLDPTQRRAGQPRGAAGGPAVPDQQHHPARRARRPPHPAGDVRDDGGEGAGRPGGEVGALVRRWAPRYDWAGLAEPLGVYEHPHAQFRPLAGVRRELPGPRTAVDNLILAGDTTTHPSIEGAVASGVRAAEIVDALTP